MFDVRISQPHLTTREVAKILRLERETVQQYTREGKLAGIKVGRQYLYTQEAVRAFLVARGG